MTQPNTVTVHILDKEYCIACPQDERANLESAARYLDGKMREIRTSGKVIGADRVAVMAALNITHDLLPQRAERTLWLKVATVGTTAVALMLALSGSQNVFSLVLFAWSALASAFAPLLFVLAFGGRPSEGLATAMMLAGVAVAIGWRLLGWHDAVYEGMPGILSGLVVYALLRSRSREAIA